ncbi:hypothetical protein ADL19_05695 [Streptomyces purpurogeneiscleroticus]|nr:hypothetical protein ADL19_05695 [Streptomyces purpurogeneiscleroticus]
MRRSVGGGRNTQETATIVGIHGLGNKPPVDEKRRWWEAAIREGLSRNEHLHRVEAAFEFVYWADLRYDAPLDTSGNQEPYRPYPGAGPLSNADEAPAISTGTLLAPVYEGLDWVQSKTGITPLDDVILEYRFDDLWHYHAEDPFAQRVRSRLIDRLDTLRDGRILLAAHSMGSVIAYDVLRFLEQHDPMLRVDHFVTLGSPLGLAKVKLKAEAEFGSLRVPGNVAAWTNLYDGEDVVAITGALASDYVPNGGVRVQDVQVVNDYTAPNGGANHHKSYGYLRTPEFSNIASAFAGARGWLEGDEARERD